MMGEKKVSSDSRIEELEAKVAALEEELRASMYREEMMTLKVKRVKKEYSWLKRKLNDKNSKVGKVMRSPRTIYRVVMNPKVREDLRKRREGINEEGEAKEKKKGAQKKEKLRFAPLSFSYKENKDFRVNLVLEKLEKEALERAIEFATRNKGGLRVITYGAENPQLEYRKLAKKYKFPAIENMSFYDAAEQGKRDNPFRLEVGENDIFLTRAWRKNEK